MEVAVHRIEYTDSKTLFTELHFAIACDRISRKDLINVRLVNENVSETFRNSATRILKAMKREGTIKLFVFENDIENTEKTEVVYLLNKFPNLPEITSENPNSIFIKL
jgi:hypothetical protein